MVVLVVPMKCLPICVVSSTPLTSQIVMLASHSVLVGFQDTASDAVGLIYFTSLGPSPMRRNSSSYLAKY
eukprot:1009804-Rhodomonas_salina.12